MNASISRRIVRTVATLALAALAAPPARAEVLEKTAKVGGVTVQYKVVLPDGYDSGEGVSRRSSRSAAVRRR